MSTVIRADTDQLRAVARQMRSTADQITSGNDGMFLMSVFYDLFLRVNIVHKTHF